MTVNETALVRIEEHHREKVVCFSVNCVDPEDAAWGELSKWCRENLPDCAARRFLGVAPLGHHRREKSIKRIGTRLPSIHGHDVSLWGDECSQTEFFGKKVEDAPADCFS